MPNTCPYFNNEQALKGYNTISDIYPELCDYWSSKNLLKSDEVTFCSFKKTAKGYNDLETTHPWLIKEWSTLNKQEMSSVRVNSIYIAWWICQENPEHRYKIQVKERMAYRKRNKKACSICKGYRRKQEHFIQFKKDIKK